MAYFEQPQCVVLETTTDTDMQRTQISPHQTNLTSNVTSDVNMTSSPGSATARPLDPDEITMLAILDYSSKYVPPIAILFGLFGNTMAYLVLSLPRYKRSSNCCYMRCLAVFDNITLIGRYVQRYIYMVWPYVFLTDNLVAQIFCRQFLFISYVYMSVAHWTLSFMALDRLIAVSFPLKAKAFCTIKRARICICVNFIILNIIFLPNFWRDYVPAGLTLTKRCPLAGFFSWYNSALNILYYGVCHTVPVVVLFISNMGIVLVVKRNKRRRDSMVLATGKLERNTERNITIMLLLVSWTFMILLVPVVVDYFFWDVFKALEIEGRTATIRKFLYEFIRIPRMLNSSVNFYLYFLGCKKFREDLKSIFSKGRKAWHSSQGDRSSVKWSSHGSVAARKLSSANAVGSLGTRSAHSNNIGYRAESTETIETLNSTGQNSEFVHIATKDECTRL